MKSNKLFWFAVFIVSSFVFLVGFGFMQAIQAELDPDLVALLNGVAVLAMTALFKWLGTLAGKDMGGWVAITAAALSAFVVALINSGLSLIPETYTEIVMLVMRLLVALFTGAGLFSIVKHFKPSRASG